jgi:hypothetical protein
MLASIVSAWSSILQNGTSHVHALQSDMHPYSTPTTSRHSARPAAAPMPNYSPQTPLLPPHSNVFEPCGLHFPGHEELHRP